MRCLVRLNTLMSKGLKTLILFTDEPFSKILINSPGSLYVIPALRLAQCVHV